MGDFQSGQMEQTVNLLSQDYGGSNPSSPTRKNKVALGRFLGELFFSVVQNSIFRCQIMDNRKC